VTEFNGRSCRTRLIGPDRSSYVALVDSLNDVGHHRIAQLFL